MSKHHKAPPNTALEPQGALGVAQDVRLLLLFRVAWHSFWSLGGLAFMKTAIIFIGILVVLIFVGCSKSRVPSSSTSSDYKPPTFNEQKVPDNLRDLLPLAAKWGIDDGASRSNKLASATEQDKQELQQALRGRAKAINRWLHSFPSDTAAKQGMSTEARAYLYMMSAVDEMGLKIQ